MKHVFVFAAILLLVSSFSVFAGGQDEVASSGPIEMKVSVWTRIGANALEHWRADVAYDAAKVLNKELKAEGSNITVVIDTVKDEGDWSDYKKKFAMAAEDGQGPDIVVSGHEDIPIWANAGYIIPLADSVSEIKSMAPEFDDVIVSLWNSTIWHGKIWAVPQDTEARPMFFSKSKLRELGWSEEKIEALPDEIAKGNFSLEDLISTAQDAIKAGVVKPGYGYWHRPRKGGDYIQYYVSNGGTMYDAEQDKLVIVKDALIKWYAFQRKIVDTGITPDKYIGTEWKIWHDVVANSNALFWNGGIWQWNDWAKNYTEGGEAVLNQNTGYALQPAAQRGGKAGTLSHPLVYMITTEKVSGNGNRDIVLRLLEKMTTPELNTRHAVDSTHIGILESQKTYPAYIDSEFLSNVTYMLDYNYYQPNHVMYGMWFDTVWDGMLAAEQGEKTPEEAADGVIELLKMELGDSIIVK